MFKTDLINAVAEKTGMTKTDARKALEATMETITETMEKGEKVTLVGWGTFSVARRSERNSTNPSTREPMVVPAKNVVKFKAGVDLSGVVN
jgi:DNA-binding protein HU-beta